MSQPKLAVLVPLYVYPWPGAWDPLHTAITAYPSVNFTIIINPSSGPGHTPLPDENYMREVPKLNSHPNATLVGYVTTSYCTKPLRTILDEFKLYSGWKEHLGMALNGIFLDETPRVWREEHALYLQHVKDNLYHDWGKDSFIIHNPGTIPDPRYMQFCTQAVVFEGAYSTFISAEVRNAIEDFSKACRREQLAVIVHAHPQSKFGENQGSFIEDLGRSVGSLFVTDLCTDYYSSFSGKWAAFVSDVDSTGS